MKNMHYLQFCKQKKNFKCIELFANDFSILAMEARISVMNSSNPM